VDYENEKEREDEELLERDLEREDLDSCSPNYLKEEIRLSSISTSASF
jgi:hypothetical protein